MQASLGPVIPLEDLPRWSLWPSRLLGLTPWETPERTLAKVAAEYDGEKYAACLRFLEESDERPAIETLRGFDIGDPEQIICVSHHSRLWEMSQHDARERYARIVTQALQDVMNTAATVIELGCGYGYNMWRLRHDYPDHRFVGGEYSINAIELARRLFTDVTDVHVTNFNYYDAHYDVLAEASGDGPMIVFTSHSVEQLPSAAVVIDGLREYRSAIEAVFHFEPILGLAEDDLLGLLRRRYCVANDYNRDLLELLKRCADVEVVRTEHDVLGINPLNPTSVIAWRFSA